MKPIRFRCKNCDRKLEVGPEGGGLRVACPECGAILRIPTRTQMWREEDVSGDEAPKPDDTKTVQIVISPEALRLRRIIGITGWAFLLIGACFGFILTEARVVAAPFLVGAIAFAVVLLVQRKLASGISLMVLSFIALQLVIVSLIVGKGARAAKRDETVFEDTAAMEPAVKKDSAAKGGKKAVVEKKVVPAPTRTPRATQKPRAVQKPKAAQKGDVVPAKKPLDFSLAVGKKRAFPFKLYGDCDDGIQPYFPYGFMGNIDDIELNECWESGALEGNSCLQFTYHGSRKWAGVAWQDPANNWGDMPGGYDLSGAKKLTFWARGESGFEVVEFKMGLLGVSKKYTDSTKAALGKVRLQRRWTKYEIPLTGHDLSRIVVAFVWIVEGVDRPIIFYLDEVQFE